MLALLALVFALGSSSALTLCVHDGHVGFEPSWELCCESAACCSALECHQPEGPEQGSARDAGCQDYVLALGSEWVPSEAGGEVPLDAFAWRPLPALSAVQLCPRPLPPPGLRGVPPPLQPQRSPILRC